MMIWGDAAFLVVFLHGLPLDGVDVLDSLDCESPKKEMTETRGCRMPLVDVYSRGQRSGITAMHENITS